MNINIPTKGIGYQPIDFENAMAKWLAVIFDDMTFDDPVDDTKTLPLNIFVSDVPERAIEEINNFAPYVLVQFVQQQFLENGCLLEGRLIVCTYGTERVNTRRDVEILGGHIMQKLSENYLSVLSPFSVYLKNEYPITFQMIDNNPVPNYALGTISFHATAYNISNSMTEALNNALK